MVLIAFFLSLAAPSRAQVAPAPVGQVDAANLEDVFKRFASGRPMIPTLKEVQAEQLKRDLSPRPERAESLEGPATSFAQRNRPSLTNIRRLTSESVDVAMSRPLPRVELGAGYSETNVYEGQRHLEDTTRKYAFLRLDLSKNPLPRKFLHSPTATHTETEAGEKIRVDKDEYTMRFMTHPTGD